MEDICKYNTAVVKRWNYNNVILAVLACWNELLVAMLMLNQPFIKPYLLVLWDLSVNIILEYTQLCGSCNSLSPGLIFYALLKEKIVKGMTVGAIKG